HLTEKPLDERWSMFRMIVEEACVAGARAGFADISRLDLALPLGVQQIPIGSKLLYIDELRVVVDGTIRCRTDIVKYVLAFRIGILVLFKIPHGLIGNLGQDQRRSDRVERFRRIELLIVWIRPWLHYIGNIFFSAASRENALP